VFGNNNAEVTYIRDLEKRRSQTTAEGSDKCVSAVKQRRVERLERMVRQGCKWTRERKRTLYINQIQITRLHDNIQDRGSGLGGGESIPCSPHIHYRITTCHDQIKIQGFCTTEVDKFL